MEESEFSFGVDFILNHLQPPTFPRTIMTKELGRQKEIFNRESLIQYFQASSWEDCRINAYGSYTDFHGINRCAPTFFMIDLDLMKFGSRNQLDRSLTKILKNINSISATPTVLWTGNGYHIYQPIDGFILDEYDIFAEFIDPAKQDLTSRFIRFCEEFFSAGKSDPNHRPSVHSCLLRVPNTFNSKWNEQVRVVQEWNGQKPAINYLLREFRTYLIDEEMKESLNKNSLHRNKIPIHLGQSSTISWIEKLLVNPISDYRKNAIALIMAPYLVNIRRVSYDSAYATISEWLTRCNSLKKLDFNIAHGVRVALLQAAKSRIPPMKFDTLKSRNKDLYEML
jgi:Primase X